MKNVIFLQQKHARTQKILPGWGSRIIYFRATSYIGNDDRRSFVQQLRGGGWGVPRPFSIICIRASLGLYSTIQQCITTSVTLEVSSIPYHYHYDHFQGRILQVCTSLLPGYSGRFTPAAKQMQDLGFHDQIRKCQMFAPVNSLCSIPLIPMARTVSCCQN